MSYVQKILILVAIVVYGTVVACSVERDADDLTDASQPAAELTPAQRTAMLQGLPFRSIGMQIQRVDWIDRYMRSIDKVAAIGADTVLLVVDARQQNGGSSHIYLDLRTTPSIEKLGDLIDHAKSLRLRVILMPIVLLDNPRDDKNEWRGKIEPDGPNGSGWEDWFNSYRDMITHFATIAQLHQVDLLVVGSELLSTEDKIDQWTRTIAAVRAIYKGRLTYSSNWDHYNSIHFWNQLDLIGMNSYWSLGSDRNVSVDQIVHKWKKIQGDLATFQQHVGKPLVLLEVGWCSLANMATEPWDYTQDKEPIDMDLQKRLYQGFFEAWYGNPMLGGFSMWEWTPGDGGKGYTGTIPEGTSDEVLNGWRGYTPEGKPAEQVLRQWLAKPRWKVE